jgi:multiple sugar transport system substrate-binding protein
MPAIWIAGVPVGSARQELGLTFLNWLVSSETQRTMVELTLPPIIATAYADDALIDLQPHLPRMLDLIASSSPRPRSPYYAQLESLLAAQLELLLDGEQTPEVAMRSANMAMREFLSREGVLVS